MPELAAVTVGYLIGSILPAYLIGRARGLDLRVAGDGNAGTRNAFRVLGAGPGVLTGAYDALKGLLAMLVAYRVFGVSEPWVYLAGVAAVFGHMFPFYLRLQGATGAATSSGLLLYCTVIALMRGWMAPITFAGILGLTAGLWFIFRWWQPAGVTMIPVLWLVVVRGGDSIAVTGLITFAATHLVAVEGRTMFRQHQLRLKAETKQRMSEMRVLMRPVAVLFPILYALTDKTFILVLVGSVALFFILVDAVRLLSKRVNVAVLRSASFFYRPAERTAFSSATLFLVGSFLTLFLFPKPVACVALLFNTFGDMAAKYVGTQQGRIPIYGRTLEGSVAYCLAAAVAGFVWSRFVPIPTAQYLLGAVAASLTELLPIDLNDNFTVPIVSATVMMVPVFFHAPGFI